MSEETINKIKEYIRKVMVEENLKFFGKIEINLNSGGITGVNVTQSYK